MFESRCLKIKWTNSIEIRFDRCSCCLYSIETHVRFGTGITTQLNSVVAKDNKYSAPFPLSLFDPFKIFDWRLKLKLLMKLRIFWYQSRTIVFDQCGNTFFIYVTFTYHSLSIKLNIQLQLQWGSVLFSFFLSLSLSSSFGSYNNNNKNSNNGTITEIFVIEPILFAQRKHEHAWI